MSLQRSMSLRSHFSGSLISFRRAIDLVQRDRSTVHIGLVGYDGEGTSWVALSALGGIARQHGEGRASRGLQPCRRPRSTVDRMQAPSSAVIRVDLVGHVLQKLHWERSRVMALGLSDPGLLLTQSVAGPEQARARES